MVSWPGRKKSEPAPAPPTASVHFTPAARQQVLEVLTREGGPGVAALRLSVKNPGAGAPQYDMALEQLGSSADTVIDAGGFSVVIDAASLPEVDGATVDFVNDPLRPGFRVDPPQIEVPSGAIGAGLDRENPLAAQVRFILDQHINPGIASHGGHAHLVGIQDDVVYLALGGGCQGCAMASVTLKQGIEQVIKQALPQVRAVVDATDHAGGANPFYTSTKDAESPFHQPAKA
jgi:Fe/S biogenesis protein NfuA